ncbi:lymphotactin-like [Bufo gargarizans]|uniref:lymphotactin-like n=1 Tax=Bufo gargarizans TaxID=30331 RepID=UPI001CF2B4E4|nr:lymphotactin-like [Bufo gargarizans]
MKLRHILLLIFIGVVLSAIESQGLGFDYKDVYPCLEVQTRKVNIKILQSYTIKTIPFNAVLFFAKNGVKICADPNQAWVKKAINTLDKQAQNQSKKGTSQKKVKKTTTKTKKNAGKKTRGKPKKRSEPSKKASPV